jgi:hypothetical protein
LQIVTTSIRLTAKSIGSLYVVVLTETPSFNPQPRKLKLLILLLAVLAWAAETSPVKPLRSSHAWSRSVSEQTGALESEIVVDGAASIVAGGLNKNLEVMAMFSVLTGR